MPSSVVKKPLSQTKLTPWHYEQIDKCFADPVFFIKNFVYIQHPIRGRLKFDLYEFQEECLRDYRDFRFNIVVKSRQLGISTITSAYALWVALFNQDANVIIMTTRLDTSKLMVGKIRTMFALLPPWMKQLLDISEPEGESVKHLKLSNGSKILALPNTPEAVRGEAVTLLIIDEAAHIENMHEIWTAASPTLSTGGSAILFSSPLGRANFFYEAFSIADTGMYMENRHGKHCDTNGPNEFHAISLPWNVHPERDQAWFEKECKTMSEESVAQEFLCDFLSSGRTFIEEKHIQSYRDGVKHPTRITSPKGCKDSLWIWEDPKEGSNYVIGADVATGDGSDFSTFYVIEIKSSTVVAEFMGKLQTDIYGQVLYEVGMLYNAAMICVESNTYGIATLNELKRKLHYPNLWYEKMILDRWEYMSEQQRFDARAGLYTQGGRREHILEHLSNVLRNNVVRVRSTRFVEQLQTFIWSGGKLKASKGKHDDLIMAMAITQNMYDAYACRDWKDDRAAGNKAWMNAFLAGIGVSKTKLDTRSSASPVMYTQDNTTGSTPEAEAEKKKKERMDKEMKTNPALRQQLAMWGWLGR